MRRGRSVQIRVFCMFLALFRALFVAQGDRYLAARGKEEQHLGAAPWMTFAPELLQGLKLPEPHCAAAAACLRASPGSSVLGPRPMCRRVPGLPCHSMGGALLGAPPEAFLLRISSSLALQRCARGLDEGFL